MLAGSAVTNTGGSLIQGELGVSPGTAISGFPPGVVTGGTIHSNDAVAQQAQADLVVAYNALAGTPCNTNLTGQDLGGLTLLPGVYCFSTSAQLTGTLTLNAQNNPDAVFIFQIGSSLTTASGSRVQVINGGSNCNVFWQVGSSATLGTSTSFTGNILALTSITLNTSANVAGRILARNGAVTLDSNAVAVCPAAVVCPAITLAPASLPNATSGALYSQTLTASGGTAPYSFSISAGALPPGLTLVGAGSSALLSGMPTLAGTYTFTVLATDAAGCPGLRIYTLVVNPAVVICPTISLTPATLPNAVNGVQYSQTISASGGTSPYVFSVSAGALPPGLTLAGSGANALLAGLPNLAGSYTFTISATDAAGCAAAQVYTLLVNPPIVVCPTISFTPLTLPGAIVGQPYNQTLSASGGTAPYAFSVTSGVLPPALALVSSGSSSALLSGTPLNAGSGVFTITVVDAAGCSASRQLTLVVNPPVCPVLNLSPLTLPQAVVGQPYNQTLNVTGGTAPYTFAVTTGILPQSLTLLTSGSSSALLSGTPQLAGQTPITITATDSAGCAVARSLLIVVTPAACPAISLTPAILPAAIAGRFYSQTINASGGTSPYTFLVSAGALPPGLTLVTSGPGTAVLSGVPTGSSLYAFTITATDAAGCAGQLQYTLLSSIVSVALPSLSQAALYALMGLMALVGGMRLRRS